MTYQHKVVVEFTISIDDDSEYEAAMMIEDFLVNTIPLRAFDRWPEVRRWVIPALPRIEKRNNERAEFLKWVTK